jgi:single-stranded DNA-binding protein
LTRFGADVTSHVSVTCWNRSAEVAGQEFAKGRLDGVEGRIRHHQWSDDSGGADNVTTSHRASSLRRRQPAQG